MPTELQQKILSLREKYQSSDSAPFIDTIESDLVALFKQKDLLKNPVFKAFVQKAEKAINEISMMLESDEEMWSEKGKLVAKEREVYRQIVGAFGVEYNDNAIKKLEEFINTKLEE